MRALHPRSGEHERAGRWWWESDADKECGIHCSVGLLGSKTDSEREAEAKRSVALAPTLVEEAS